MRFPFHFIAAAGLIGIGISAVQNPRPASRQYGLPAKDKIALAFVRGCGVRDIALGCMLLGAKKGSPLPFLAVAMVGLGDFFTVSSTSDDPPLPSLGTHALGFAGALSIALFTKSA